MTNSPINSPEMWPCRVDQCFGANLLPYYQFDLVHIDKRLGVYAQFTTPLGEYRTINRFAWATICAQIIAEITEWSQK